MRAFVGMLGWVFIGEAPNFTTRLIQWWLRIVMVWMLLVVLFAASAVATEPEVGNLLVAWLTIEAGAGVALVASLAAIVAFYVLRALVFISLFIAAVLGVIR